MENFKNLKPLIEMALNEDLLDIGDVTSEAIFSNESYSYKLMAKESGILCGIDIFAIVMNYVDNKIATYKFLMEVDKKSMKSDLYKNSINLKGEIIVTSQVYRTQEQNLDDAYKKLRDMVFHASLTEKERKFLIPPETENLAKRRIESKRKKGDIKKTRSGGRDY